MCRPEKLRQHVPEEREALLSIKRACAAQLAQSLMGRWRVQVGAEALSPFEQQQHTAGGVAAGSSTHRRGACQGQRAAASRCRELPSNHSSWQPIPSLCITHASPQSLLQPAFPPPCLQPRHGASAWGGALWRLTCPTSPTAHQLEPGTSASCTPFTSQSETTPPVLRASPG